MNTDPIRNTNCLRGGCSRWWGAAKAGLAFKECERCGFDAAEAERRRGIPLRYCKDGLQRKIIPRKPNRSEDINAVDKEGT